MQGNPDVRRWCLRRSWAKRASNKLSGSAYRRQRRPSGVQGIKTDPCSMPPIRDGPSRPALVRVFRDTCVNGHAHNQRQ